MITTPDLTSHQRPHFGRTRNHRGSDQGGIAGYELITKSDYYASNRLTAVRGLLERYPKVGAWDLAAKAPIPAGPSRHKD
ncbi:MAG: hypothetical protein ACPGVU_09065, partial [Limisphaerales bacterium]